MLNPALLHPPTPVLGQTKRTRFTVPRELRVVMGYHGLLCPNAIQQM